MHWYLHASQYRVFMHAYISIKHVFFNIINKGFNVHSNMHNTKSQINILAYLLTRIFKKNRASVYIQIPSTPIHSPHIASCCFF